MPSEVRIALIALAVACVIGGGGVLYLDVSNDPMSYYSVTGAFDYQYAIVTALVAGAFLGLSLFPVGLMLYGIGYLFLRGFRIMVSRNQK
jgi:hypothetical protein